MRERKLTINCPARAAALCRIFGGICPFCLRILSRKVMIPERYVKWQIKCRVSFLKLRLHRLPKWLIFKVVTSQHDCIERNSPAVAAGKGAIPIELHSFRDTTFESIVLKTGVTDDEKIYFRHPVVPG